MPETTAEPRLSTLGESAEYPESVVVSLNSLTYSAIYLSPQRIEAGLFFVAEYVHIVGPKAGSGMSFDNREEQRITHCPFLSPNAYLLTGRVMPLPEQRRPTSHVQFLLDCGFPIPVTPHLDPSRNEEIAAAQGPIWISALGHLHGSTLWEYATHSFAVEDVSALNLEPTSPTFGQRIPCDLKRKFLPHDPDVIRAPIAFATLRF